MLMYLYLLCQDKNANKQTPLSVVNTLTQATVPVKNRRLDLGRLLSLQGECCFMMKMNMQEHSSLTTSEAGLLI